MIGDKIIRKIFADNINDYLDQHEQDMEPIMNLCSIITRVLVILKELDVKNKAADIKSEEVNKVTEACEEQRTMIEAERD